MKYLFLDNRALELGTAWHFPQSLKLPRGEQVTKNGMYADLYGPCANIRRVVHQPVRHPQFPLIAADQPWESKLLYFGGNFLIRDPATNKLRLYYQTWSMENSTEHAKFCLAESDDGLRWTKPILNSVSWNGSTRNNIVIDGPVCGAIWGGLIYDHREADPGRKWKALCFGSPGSWHGVCVHFSPDGVNWTPYPHNPVLTARVDAGDTYALFGWDENVNKYVAYLRPQDWYSHYPDTPYFRYTGGKWPFGNSDLNHPYRTIGRSVSDDFVHWSVPEEILAPDLEDELGVQFYGMTVGRYENYYVGNLWIYNTASNDDTMRIELTSSPDGIKWNRLGNRKKFIDIGNEGPYHSGMILATTSPYLVIDDEIWIYYSAFNCTHYGTRFGERQAGIGLCKLRLDGFLSLAAGEPEGYFLSRPIDWTGRPLELEINAKAERGWIKVGIVGEDHKPIDGYTDAECAPFHGDQLRHIVRWDQNKNLAKVGNRRAYLMFRLQNAEIFSFSIREPLAKS